MRAHVGQYRIEAPIGRGGMGVVYRGVHEHLGRPVAVKALAPELTQQPEFKERFFAEAKTQARLQHPNIVAVYDLLEDGGEFFIVMELVDGRGLDEVLKVSAGQGLGFQEALTIFSQVLAGLDYAHSEGVIHRDIKPSNVLISESGRVKLTDFGIALLLGDKRLTASQSAIGTPTYMSPEQIVRPRAVDHRADLYSAAVVLFEMLAGQPPFDDETEYAIKKLHVEAPPPDLSILKPNLPVGAARSIMVALAKEPDDRFASAGLFLRNLQEAAGFTQPPPIYSTAQTFVSVGRTDVEDRVRLRKHWMVAGLAAVLLLSVAGIALFGGRPHQDSSIDSRPAAPLTSAPSSGTAEHVETPVPSQALGVSNSEEKRSEPAPAVGEAKPAVKAKPREPVRSASLQDTPSLLPESTPVPSAGSESQSTLPEPDHQAETPATGSGVDQFKEMEELILSVESYSKKILDAYEQEDRGDQLQDRLESFLEAAIGLRKEFRRVTGTGIRGFGQSLKHVFRRGGREMETRALEIKVEDLKRRAEEIDNLMATSPPGQTTQDFWREIRRNLSKLIGYF